MLASLGLPGAVIVPCPASPDGYVFCFMEGSPDIMHRGFCHGVTDCFALVRDYYAAHFNIFCLIIRVNGPGGIMGTIIIVTIMRAMIVSLSRRASSKGRYLPEKMRRCR